MVDFEPVTDRPPSVDRMRGRWREFARRDPMYYVASNRRDWDAESFFRQGRELVDEILDWAGPGIGRERMLEVGCGLGRMLVHFAPHFERVDGIDIAPEMVAAARSHDPPPNMHLTVGSGADLRPYEDASFDFVFSFQVFQHVPDLAVIAGYLDEIQRVLRPGGRAVVQFDSRAMTAVTRAILALPDGLLPRSRRRFIRRYRLDPDQPVAMAAASGLRLLDERGPRTADHFLLLERPDSSSIGGLNGDA